MFLQNNAYGVMKIEDEKRFLTIAARKKMPLCMPRLFNLSGPFINKFDLYALASMIRSVLSGQPIAIRAPHNVVRSYIHVSDLVALAFAMLLEPNPQDQPVFDTAGDRRAELGELAECVLEALNCPDLSIQRPARVEDQDDVYVGDGRMMRNMMQEHGMLLTSLPDQIRDTAAYMQTVLRPYELQKGR